jgi:hypothetical protein
MPDPGLAIAGTDHGGGTHSRNGAAQLPLDSAASSVRLVDETNQALPTERRTQAATAGAHSPGREDRLSLVVSEPSPNAPPTVPEIADGGSPIAPGLGPLDTDSPMQPPSPTPPTPQAASDQPATRLIRYDNDLLVTGTLDRPLSKSPFGEPAQTVRKVVILGVDKASSFFNRAAATAFVALVILGVSDSTWQQVSDIVRALPPWPEQLISKEGTTPARLVVETHRGFANDPLPLGISLNAGSGGETVTIAGLAEGTSLSLGSPVGGHGWLLSAHDLDRVFIGPPKDFVGTMDVTVQLRSFTDRVLDSRRVRFEWDRRAE